MDECAKRRGSLLEVEYQDEPGTGSGPTAEFFVVVSQEMHTTAGSLWRAAGLEGAALGLFPRPQEPATTTEAKKPPTTAESTTTQATTTEEDEVTTRFRTLGRLLGQALMDERLLDIRLAPPLVAALSGLPLCASLPAALQELAAVDMELGKQVRLSPSSQYIRPIQRQYVNG
jgi:E3 ubiquitin-protein ligase TRIP12